MLGMPVTVGYVSGHYRTRRVFWRANLPYPRPQAAPNSGSRPGSLSSSSYRATIHCYRRHRRRKVLGLPQGFLLVGSGEVDFHRSLRLGQLLPVTFHYFPVLGRRPLVAYLHFLLLGQLLLVACRSLMFGGQHFRGSCHCQQEPFGVR
jgi:hypothetical protein